MPGFGSSDELPFMERTLPGYAAWVERFLDALGLDEPVLILGHSFGGGIATRFAHDHPERVRYLVLLNSVGDPRAMGASGLTTRLPGLGSLKSMIDTFRPAEDLATTGLMQRTLLANMRRHPFTVMQSAQAAFFADLRTEMAALAARELPVLVLWSDDDRMIPLTAFDTFCSTFGTDGQVVHGGHSWLLADPEVFGEVLDNVIQVQGGEHGARAATANVEVLRDLLATTSLPRPVVSKLLDGVSPLWALSESPEVLAADLVLCHPPVADGEVRAVARELPGSGMFRLTVVAHDRPGFLADTTAVLAATGASVEGASVMTWPERGLALHAVTVHSPHGIDADSWDEIGFSCAPASSGRCRQRSSRPGALGSPAPAAGRTRRWCESRHPTTSGCCRRSAGGSPTMACRSRRPASPPTTAWPTTSSWSTARSTRNSWSSTSAARPGTPAPASCACCAD